MKLDDPTTVIGQPDAHSRVDHAWTVMGSDDCGLRGCTERHLWGAGLCIGAGRDGNRIVQVQLVEVDGFTVTLGEGGPHLEPEASRVTVTFSGERLDEFLADVRELAVIMGRA